MPQLPERQECEPIGRRRVAVPVRSPLDGPERVRLVKWRTSSYCGASNTCVQVAAPAPSRDVLVRDGADPSAGIIAFRRDAFVALVRSVQASGRLDVQTHMDEAPVPVIWHMEAAGLAVPECGAVLDEGDVMTRTPVDVTCPDCLLRGWDA